MKQQGADLSHQWPLPWPVPAKLPLPGKWGKRLNHKKHKRHKMSIQTLYMILNMDIQDAQD